MPLRETSAALLMAAVAVALAVPFLHSAPDMDEPAELQDLPLDPATVFEGIRRDVAPGVAMDEPEDWDGPGWCCLTEAWLKRDRTKVLRGTGWSARLEVSEDLGWKKPNILVPRPSCIVGVQVYFVDPDWLASGDESEGLARILVFAVPPIAELVDEA